MTLAARVAALLDQARVGPEGGVLGVDLSPALIAAARRHAAGQGMGNVGASPP